MFSKILNVAVAGMLLLTGGVLASKAIANQGQREKLNIAWVTQTARGFEPSTLRLNQGKVRLAVNNRSGLTEVDYDLVAVQGNKSVAKRKSSVRDWREWVMLTPGQYVLRENTSGAQMDIFVEQSR